MRALALAAALFITTPAFADYMVKEVGSFHIGGRTEVLSGLPTKEVSFSAGMPPIKMDPNWKNGDYFGGPEPTEGVAQSLKTVTLTALHFGWAEKAHGYKWAAEGKDPADAMGNLFAIEDSLYKTGHSRASSTDAAHFVWMAKANQLYNLEKQQANIKAKVLFLPAKTDMIFPPALSQRWAEKLKAQGNHVELYEIDGTSGHLDGLFSIAKVSDQIRAFLTK